jgi:hypothetical protein
VIGRYSALSLTLSPRQVPWRQQFALASTILRIQCCAYIQGYSVTEDLPDPFTSRSLSDSHDFRHNALLPISITPNLQPDLDHSSRQLLATRLHVDNSAILQTDMMPSIMGANASLSWTCLLFSVFAIAGSNAHLLGRQGEFTSLSVLMAY